MDFLRRMSTRSEPLDEEQIKQLSHQRRKSSIAMDEDLVLPSAITPPIQIFPNSTSTMQETLLISPDPTAKGFVITYARTGNHLLTVATAALSVPGPSHTKYFYGELTSANEEPEMRRKDSEGSTTSSHSSYSGKLCTLVRDVISFRRRHHVDDPRNGQRLLEIEFTTSSWEAGQLKAAICLLSKYNDLRPMEPVKLRWKGRKTSLEGVLEWNNKPAAVCAKGEETDKGQYVLYVAPGMDLYVACIVVMAVDDRASRGANDSSRSNGH